MHLVIQSRVKRPTEIGHAFPDSDLCRHTQLDRTRTRHRQAPRRNRQNLSGVYRGQMLRALREIGLTNNVVQVSQ